MVEMIAVWPLVMASTGYCGQPDADIKLLFILFGLHACQTMTQYPAIWYLYGWTVVWFY